MELIRGPKALTEIERAVAAELYRGIRCELATYIKKFPVIQPDVARKAKKKAKREYRRRRARGRSLPLYVPFEELTVIEAERAKRRAMYFQKGRD